MALCTQSAPTPHVTRPASGPLGGEGHDARVRGNRGLRDLCAEAPHSTSAPPLLLESSIFLGLRMEAASMAPQCCASAARLCSTRLTDP